MTIIVDVLAVIGAATVAFAVFGLVMFIRDIRKKGWNQ
jgi:hypothetical protein